nr:unnamed protein product [Callosobruchus analis]
MWQFENCLGAMDGKHILIKKPSNSGSYYFNYKGTFSVVLFAIVNANYEFLYVHTGTNGRVSDGGIWNNTGICKCLKANKLNIPNPTTLLNTSDQFPYVFIGDEAFPLMENLMKPYQQKGISHEEKIFNYRLCRARRVVENVFGILASRFRIFLQPIAIDIESIDAVVLACCALHNFLRKRSKKNYITESSVDYEDIVNGTVIPGEWRQNGNLLGLDRKNTTKNASNSAKEIRNKYKNYYNSFGKTSFQEKMIA